MSQQPINVVKEISKRVLRSISIAVAIGLPVLFIFSGVFTVSEQENVVLLTAGKYTDTKTAGLHFKLPVVQKIKRVNMTTQGMEVNYSDTGEDYPSTEESMMITQDFNIVSFDLYTEWRVTDPSRYLFNVSEPKIVLGNVIQSSARDIVSSYGVDSVLTDGKSEIQGKIKELVNNVLDNYDIGILVTNIIIQDVEPPNEAVKLAFKAVEDAKQKKDTLLNEANRYYNENIPSARAEADKITKSAEAIKEARIYEARGQVSRFNEMYAEYSLNPEITKSRMYYEMIEKVFPSLKVLIDSADSGTLKMFDITQN